MELRLCGPPGTGKTTELSKVRIPRAVAKYGAENVIVASHTRAAAREIGSRNAQLPKNNVGTLHAICYRALGHPTMTQNHLDEWNEYTKDYKFTLFGKKQSLDDPFDDAATDQTEGDLLSGELTIARAKMIPKEKWSEQLNHFSDEWSKWKVLNDYTDFTDLIDLCYKDLECLEGNPKVGIMDESQDFTNLQLSLVRKWFNGEGKHLLIAGDDDQNLYTFAGTSSDAFLNPPIDKKFMQILTQSYRVPKTVHKLANKWIKQNKTRVKKDYLPTDKEGFVENSGASFDEPEYFLDTIKENIKNDESTMILASCSYMLKKFLKVLREEGIPFCNPYRKNRRDWNPLSKGRKNSVSMIDRILSFLLPEHSFPPVWNYIQLSRFVDILDAKSCLKHGAKVKLSRLAKNKLANYELDEILKAETSHQYDAFSNLHKMKLDNRLNSYYTVLSEFFQDSVAEKLVEFLNKGDIDYNFLSTNIMKGKYKLAEFLFSTYKQGGVEALTETPKVIVGTIHSVKGGEAENVILSPDLSNAGYRNFQDYDMIDTVIRMFYVAMTRTSNKLLIAQPSSWCVELGI
jgi:superfamily I DNA/RNA helicase